MYNEGYDYTYYYIFEMLECEGIWDSDGCGDIAGVTRGYRKVIIYIQLQERA